MNPLFSRNPRAGEENVREMTSRSHAPMSAKKSPRSLFGKADADAESSGSEDERPMDATQTEAPADAPAEKEPTTLETQHNGAHENGSPEKGSEDEENEFARHASQKEDAAGKPEPRKERKTKTKSIRKPREPKAKSAGALSSSSSSKPVVARRHAKVSTVRDPLCGLRKSQCRRVVYRGGAHRLRASFYPHMRAHLTLLVRDAVYAAAVVADYSGRKTIRGADVEHALENRGRGTIYGCDD
jgi:histone H3/H4